MAESPGRVVLRVGEEHSVTLPGLGTAGYVWEHHIEGPEGVVQVTWQTGPPPGGATPAVGASAPETAVLRGLAPGEVTVRLVQRRPWETGVAPHREETIAVRVVGAG